MRNGPKSCWVCGIEGRALCYSCQGNIASASPKHQAALKARHADPKFAKEHSERGRIMMKALNADPKFAKENSERMKALHADPKFAKALSERGRIMMKALNADPKFAKAHSERGRIRIKALNADPKFAKKRIEGLKARHADPKFAKAHSERGRIRIKALNADPEFARANSERMKARRADPTFNEVLRKGLAAKPTWPEAVFYGNVFGWLNGTKGFHVQESIPTEHCRHTVDARLGSTIYELDGGGHHAHEDHHEHDRLLDADYAEMGYQVVRATNATDLFLKFLQTNRRLAFPLRAKARM